MVKTILFDFWGTLVENGVWSPIKQVKNILDIKLPFSEYVLRMERAMMTRKFDGLRASFTSICDEFNIQCTEEQYEQLIGMWNKSWMLSQPYEEIMEELSNLKQKYQLILVSNTDCFSLPKVLEKYELEKYFTNVFLSCDLGMIKSDPRFFKKVLNELNLNINECVMVGDSIQSDIIAAKRLGIKAVLVDRRNTRDFHPKIKNLKELENVLEL
jgi:putative hydrolase of the HAD superfamily